MRDFASHLITRNALTAALTDIGVHKGDIICAHIAMSRLGYVCGGARIVIEALCDAVGSQGTLMMPAHTRDSADPREWRYPPPPEDWIDSLVAETPAYDPILSPTQNVGSVAELFRTYPGVLRSNHPISSVAAIGSQADSLVHDVPLDNRFGEDSPYGRLVRLNGKVVMLGAPYHTMSLLHLSQYKLGWGDPVVKRACMIVEGERQWVPFKDVPFPHDWANRCVAEMVRAGIAVQRKCGASYILLVGALDAIDFTVKWRKAQNC